MPAPILPLIEAASHWPDRGALIGLDLGTKTIGVAVSDPDRRLATAVETIQRTAFRVDAARLLAIAGERKAVGFVLGLPINMDGSGGPRAQSNRAFARNLAAHPAWSGRSGPPAGRRARPARGRGGGAVCECRPPPPPRRGDRPARGGLHPAGRARPPRQLADRRMIRKSVKRFPSRQTRNA